MWLKYSEPEGARVKVRVMVKKVGRCVEMSSLSKADP